MKPSLSYSADLMLPVPGAFAGVPFQTRGHRLFLCNKASLAELDMAAYYCGKCLRKYKRYEIDPYRICHECKCPLSSCKNIKSRARVVSRLATIRGIKPPSAKSRYSIYLQSKEWEVIRLRVLMRDNHRCMDCDKKATQVHHLSYSQDVMAGRDDTKLVSLCRKCHKARHGK